MHLLRRSGFALSFAVLCSVGVGVAAVPKVIDLPEILPTVATCERSAASSVDVGRSEGPCVTATQAFLALLAGAPVDLADQRITDLVLALVPLVKEDCGPYELDIAEAIRLASASVSTAEQAASIVEIADTISDCATGRTASILEESASFL